MWLQGRREPLEGLSKGVTSDDSQGCTSTMRPSKSSMVDRTPGQSSNSLVSPCISESHCSTVHARLCQGLCPLLLLRQSSDTCPKLHGPSHCLLHSEILGVKLWHVSPRGCPLPDHVPDRLALQPPLFRSSARAAATLLSPAWLRLTLAVGLWEAHFFSGFQFLPFSSES